MACRRHGSYSRAARELAVTHSAVSQQIRRLEAELGTKLFERRGAGMVPTPEAERLALQIGEGLNLLQNAVAEFAAAAERDQLVVSLDSQFSGRWLPSRLASLLNFCPSGNTPRSDNREHPVGSVVNSPATVRRRRRRRLPTPAHPRSPQRSAER